MKTTGSALLDMNTTYYSCRPERRRIKIQLTPKELSKWCLNFNKYTKETYYYGILYIDLKIN
jgi:hypothetical protein